MSDSSIKIAEQFSPDEHAVLFHGNCLDLLKEVPDRSIQLVVTSPPYNIGKEYEKKINIDTYVSQQAEVIKDCVRVLSDTGSICWQVGNYVNNGSIIPLDTILYPIFTDLNLVMRNRIIWHFEHGLHCTRRLSGLPEKQRSSCLTSIRCGFPRNTLQRSTTKDLKPVNIPVTRSAKIRVISGIYLTSRIIILRKRNTRASSR